MQLARLKDIRDGQALSMRALSERSGVSPSTIVSAEQGKPVYSVTVRKLAKALGVTPAELRGDVPAPATPEPPAPVPISDRQAVMVANLLDQAERARARGDDAGVAQFERMAAHAATADGVD